MGLRSGEVIGIAAMREFMEGELTDIELLREQMWRDNPDEFDEMEDDDYHDLGMAGYYLGLIDAHLSKIVERHDKPPKKKKSSTDLVPYIKKGNVYWPTNEEETVEKKLTEMTIQEIGEGTVLFDPKGEAWVASLWTDKIMDLKNGHITRANVKPSDLEGWSFEGETFDEKLQALALEVKEECGDEREGFVGFIAAEVVKRERVMGSPLGVIKAVYGALDKA